MLRSYWIPLAGLLAAAASGCASSRQVSADEQAQRNLNQAQDNLRQAQQDEKNAADQQKNVVAAHERTAKAQQQLAEQQKKEDEERAKANQLQRQAEQHARQANEQAQQAQALTQPQPGTVDAQGRRTVAGHLLQANPSQIVLQARNGQTMTLDVNDGTRVYVGDEQRSAADLQQGTDARVAYDESGGRPTAVTIQVPPAGTPDTPATAPGTSTGSGRSGY